MGAPAELEQVTISQLTNGETIAERFERQAAATPDAPAVLVPGGIVTYRQLNAIAETIAGRIETLSLPIELPIALAIEGDVLGLAAMLGAAKAGHIFIPLDLAFPEAYLAQTITDSGTSLILTDAAGLALADRIKGTAQVLAVEASDIAANPRGRKRRAAADSPAYILYTSGSSGKPKGVVLSHEFLIRYVNVWSNRFRIGPGDRISLLFSCNWGTGMHNTFVALLCGACVCPFEIRTKGVGALSKWLNDYRITMLVTTSSLFRTWIASLSDDERFPALRLIRNSAEPLYREDILRAAPYFAKACQIVHSLGTTETGTVAIHALALDAEIDDGILPVGHPAPGIEVRLEKENGDIAAPEEEGEIVLYGRYLALGYWRDPALTEAAFRRDPANPSNRCYRSGDFGRWRRDGQLEFLGRKDRKVKVRGFTIELYEIERALLRLPQIRDAVVILHSDGPENARLVAYVTGPKENAPDMVMGLSQQLAVHLPVHMIPSDLIILEAFPLTVRGKVDRKALPPPSPRNAEQAHRAAGNQTESALVAIWQDVLKIPRISVDANFYDLGGTSLQAFSIFARIAKDLGRDLPPTLMLQTPTIAKQAELVSRDGHTGTEGKLVTFRAHGRRLPLFVVHGAFGDIVFVREIVRDLKSDRPVYGLQPPPLDGTHTLPRTMEAIAADYLAEIRKVQPQGPYFLAGYSFGGTAALEMAQQLTRAGERAAFVGLIDTIYDSPYEVAGEKTGARLERHLRSIRGRRAFAHLAKKAWKTLTYSATRAGERLAELPNELRCRLGRAVPYQKRAPFYRLIYFRASHRYKPRPYQGAITVFSAKGKTEWHRARWSSIALGGLSVYEVPAGHFDMVWPPHSTALARHFDIALEAAD